MLFKNGMANYLEVIIAQSNVLQGELELAALKKEQLKCNSRIISFTWWRMEIKK
jgi:hypothetical protein